MSEESIKEPKTRQMAIPVDIMDRLNAIKKRANDKGGKLRLQGMAVEAFTAYCDDMEKELNK